MVERSPVPWTDQDMLARIGTGLGDNQKEATSRAHCLSLTFSGKRPRPKFLQTLKPCKNKAGKQNLNHITTANSRTIHNPPASSHKQEH